MSHATLFCPNCRVRKPTADFNKNRCTRTGHQAYCRDCQNARNRAWNVSETGRQKKTDHRKRYRQTLAGKLADCRGNQKQIANGQAARGGLAFYYRCKERGLHRNDPHKESARGKVNYAVKKGLLPRARECKCSHCQRPATQYHHHRGYDPPHVLDVIPLCRICHIRADGKETVLDLVRGESA